MNDEAKSKAVEPIRFIRKSNEGPTASLRESPTVAHVIEKDGFIREQHSIMQDYDGYWFCFPRNYYRALMQKRTARAVKKKTMAFKD